MLAIGSLATCFTAIAVVGVTADFVRTLVATFIGAALGFLVALYLERIQRATADEARRIEQADQDRRQRERDEEMERRATERRTIIARERRVRVLSLIREELGRVPDQMGQRQDRSQPPFDRLTDILWRTFSSSDELRWIDDPELLQQIASAHDLLAVEIGLENRWTELRLVTSGNAPQADNFLANQLRRFDHDTWRLVCDACKAIDATLVELGAPPGSNASNLFCR